MNGGVPAVPTKRSNASLPQYLSDLRLLAENIERYNSVTGSGAGTTRDLATLVEYLYGEEVSPGFFQTERHQRPMVPLVRHVDPAHGLLNRAAIDASWTSLLRRCAPSTRASSRQAAMARWGSAPFARP